MNEIREALESIKATLKRPLENPMQSMESAIRSALHEAEAALASPHPEAREEAYEIGTPREFAERLAWMAVNGKPDLDQWENHIKFRDAALSRLAAQKDEGQVSCGAAMKSFDACYILCGPDKSKTACGHIGCSARRRLEGIVSSLPPSPHPEAREEDIEAILYALYQAGLRQGKWLVQNTGPNSPVPMQPSMDISIYEAMDALARLAAPKPEGQDVPMVGHRKMLITEATKEAARRGREQAYTPSPAAPDPRPAEEPI